MKKIIDELRGLMLKGFYLFISLFLLQSEVFAQEIAPNNLLPLCPETSITYSISGISGYGCNFSWTVVNGSISGGNQNGTTSSLNGIANAITVKWFDTTNDGLVKVKTTNCEGGGENITIESRVSIYSIKGESPDGIDGNFNIPFGETSSENYNTFDMFFPTIGKGREREVDGYQWIIPAGWKKGGTVSDGITPIGGGTHLNRVVPNAEGGNGEQIKVRGTNVCGVPSDWEGRTIVRGVPDLEFNLPLPEFVVCSNRNSITLSVSPNLESASYIWTKPDGWRGNSSESSITLTPNGMNGGVVTVKAIINGSESEIISHSIDFELYDLNNPPLISGPAYLCTSNQTYSTSNIPPSSFISWAVSSPSDFAVDSGTGLTFTTRATNSSTSNSGIISATFHTACGDVSFSNRIWVGKPKNVLTIEDLSGPSCMLLGTFDDFLGTPFPVTVPGATSYEPSFVFGGTPQGITFYSEVNRIRVQVTVASNASMGTYTMQVAPKNTCGFGSPAYATFKTTNRIYNCRTGGGLLKYSIFPNPVNHELKLDLSETYTFKEENSINEKTQPDNLNSKKAEVLMYNNSGQLVFSKTTNDNTISISTTNMENGVYYLNVSYLGRVTKKQLIIEH